MNKTTLHIATAHVGIGSDQKEQLELLAAMANRHGLIAGATGTGKTVTLRVMAEAFSRIGVPVFLADIKGDLAGMSEIGTNEKQFIERSRELGVENFAFRPYPVTFWDVLGEEGHPIRATVSDMGPLLLSRLLQLNETQAGILTIIFKVADEQGWLLLDVKDFQAMVQYVGENAKQLTTQYGNVSTASVGAIQRALLSLSEQHADKFFGEPCLDIDDLLQTNSQGLGQVNILAASKLLEFPKVYATFLLWLLSELFERLPEVGDLEKPKLVFFFDEAHLLFDDAPRALIEKIEQVVRLIRSKGVGIYFVTQNPLDIPESVLGQLGNRVQHALRAFTPKDQKAVKTAADTFRSDGSIDVSTVITELAVGEALVSFLDANGSPTPVRRAKIVPPESKLGVLSPEQRKACIRASSIFGHYENAVDRESAYEILAKRAKEGVERSEPPSPSGAPASNSSLSRRQTPIEAFISSTARSIGSQIGRQLVRGVLGSILGPSSRRR